MRSVPKKIEAGMRFGRLITKVTVKHPNGQHWECLCDCGNLTVAYSGHLRNGSRLSCGCLNAIKNLKHGKSQSPEYKAWDNARDRCRNKNNGKYPKYGGRGIKMCERWLNSFTNFLTDMGERPSAMYTLDRIDSNGDYELDNCRWATIGQQNNNRPSFNRYIIYEGKNLTIAQASQITGIPHGTILSRLDRGKSDEEALRHAKKRIRVAGSRR